MFTELSYLTFSRWISIYLSNSEKKQFECAPIELRAISFCFANITYCLQFKSQLGTRAVRSTLLLFIRFGVDFPSRINVNDIILYGISDFISKLFYNISRISPRFPTF